MKAASRPRSQKYIDALNIARCMMVALAGDRHFSGQHGGRGRRWGSWLHFWRNVEIYLIAQALFSSLMMRAFADIAIGIMFAADEAFDIARLLRHRVVRYRACCREPWRDASSRAKPLFIDVVFMVMWYNLLIQLWWYFQCHTRPK